MNTPLKLPSLGRYKDFMSTGFATSEGTARYRARFQDKFAPDFYRVSRDLYWSALGLGTYLGNSDSATDDLYAASIQAAVESGINVLDTAVNYRFQLSERVLGKVLNSLIMAGKLKRDEIVLCSKGGFFPFDGAMPANPGEWIKTNFIDTKLIRADDVVAGCHSMHPRYLENQLNQSLKNLGVETLDVYYLHNPETQLEEVDAKEFKNRVRHAFEFFERAIAEGKIRAYGTATWSGFRQSPDAQDYLGLEEMVMLAREVAGPNHHFKYVQLPFNIAMPEAWIMANQRYGATVLPLLRMAPHLDMTVVASGSLLQGRLSKGLPQFVLDHFKDCQTTAQVNLAFSRSVQGLTTALVGMKSTAHVFENLQSGRIKASTEEQLITLFSKK